jgi:hypothetical protein
VSIAVDVSVQEAAITFAIPPVFGLFTLRWLGGKGYA